MFINGWIDKEKIYIYTYNKYYSAIKLWHIAICDRMNRSWRYNVKWNKSGIERQIPFYLSYAESKKKKRKSY